MGIIKYKKTNYRKSDVKRIFLRIYRGLQIHQLCQNENDSKDLLYQNMFTRHHVTQKKTSKTPPL